MVQWKQNNWINCDTTISRSFFYNKKKRNHAGTVLQVQVQWPWVFASKIESEWSAFDSAKSDDVIYQNFTKRE